MADIFFSRQEVDEQLDYPRYIASCCQTKTGGQFYDRFPAYVGPARQVLCQIYADERERRTIEGILQSSEGTAADKGMNGQGAVL